MRSNALHRSTRPDGCARSGREVARGSRTDGFTLVEIVIALSVLVVAASIFYQMLLGTSRLRQTNQQNALAADAARVVIEEMRNVPFLEIYKRYNEDPADDPGGAGTAPGNQFDVAGLEALAGAQGGKTGKVTFPSLFVAATPGVVGKKKIGVVGSGGTAAGWQLRENYADESLGMPRDLNGDNVVDELNHASDYIVLPVRVQVTWQGPAGKRTLEIVTQLSDFVLVP